MNRSIIIGAIIISAAILVNGFLERRGHLVSTVSALSAPAASSNQTISVLRFENLSQDNANASFADGIQRAIVTRLTEQHVKAASVEETPHTGELLLGSVEKAGNRVRINTCSLSMPPPESRAGPRPMIESSPTYSRWRVRSQRRIRRRQSRRERPNHALELTASRRTTSFSMTSTASPAATRALARSSSAFSR